jgi:HD-GYP domain-containing protein (c-di-GMP phosphodiesterase class II)
MTSQRAYRSALSREKAIEELKENRGTQFSPVVVDTFLDILEEENSMIYV